MIRTHQAGSLRAEHDGEAVVLAGWVARRRDHGGVTFVDLRDASGLVQVVFREGEPAEQAHALRSEFCVLVRGTVGRRPEGNANPDLPTGDIEVTASAAPARPAAIAKTVRFMTGSPCDEVAGRLLCRPEPASRITQPE